MKPVYCGNFEYDARESDLERLFRKYGKVDRVDMKAEPGETFAFVQYEVQEDATRALDATNNSKLMDKVISVAYAVKDDDARGNGHSPERRRDTSPERRRRSPSPYKRERGSPDYGRGGASPVAAYRKDRTSPGNGRRRSPSPYKRSRRGSHKYGRDRRGNESPRRRERYSRSPNNRRETLKKENPSGEVESPNERRSNPENGQVEGLDGGYNSAEEQVSFASSS